MRCVKVLNVSRKARAAHTDCENVRYADVISRRMSYRADVTHETSR